MRPIKFKSIFGNNSLAIHRTIQPEPRIVDEQEYPGGGIFG